MTDPRVAALAEALDAARCLTIADEYGYAAAADAILAALPPDWCGHIGVEEVIAQAQHDAACRDELARQQAAEIDRLRRVEEAALAVAGCCGIEETWGGPDQCAAHDALRAALEDR